MARVCVRTEANRARRNYERLDIISFGNHLMMSRDLDPVYDALPKAVPDDAQRHRWLLAYWCLYHCGAAAFLSELEGEEFWNALMSAASNALAGPPGSTGSHPPVGERWPRGSERRHFRGEAAIKAVNALRERYDSEPGGMVAYCAGAGSDFEAVAKRVQEHRLFGPWISFKVCDMLERVEGYPIDFSEAAVFMFKDPVKAALMLWRQHWGLGEDAKPKDQTKVIHDVVTHLTGKFSSFAPPGQNNRQVGLQEVETVLCKWKSHMNGHYPLNNDIREITEGLVPWAEASETARALAKHMPKPLEVL